MELQIKIDNTATTQDNSLFPLPADPPCEVQAKPPQQTPYLARDLDCSSSPSEATRSGVSLGAL